MARVTSRVFFCLFANLEICFAESAQCKRLSTILEIFLLSAAQIVIPVTYIAVGRAIGIYITALPSSFR